MRIDRATLSPRAHQRPHAAFGRLVIGALVVAGGSSAGNHSFDPPLSFVIDATPAFLATADFNDDGEVDLVTANSDSGGGGGSATAQGASGTAGSVTVLLNSTAPSGLEAPCVGDTDGNGEVGFADLTALLIAWGPCTPPIECPSDLSGDDQVGFHDLVLILVSWGPCE